MKQGNNYYYQRKSWKEFKKCKQIYPGIKNMKEHFGFRRAKIIVKLSLKISTVMLKGNKYESRVKSH